ncbi:MAG: fructosamine kinase family protein [Bdellovibrio bacteriovorus]
MTDWEAVGRHIAAVTGRAFAPRTHRAVGGGCINSAAILSDGDREFFVKCNRASRLDMFEAEADGLAGLAAAGAIRVPEPICWGATGQSSYLVLERLDLEGRTDGSTMGRHLAALHRTVGAGFGWRRDNYIGATSQPNPQSGDWIAFFRDQRLGYQLALAARNGHARTLAAPGERLMAGLPALLDHGPVPSLLHGDLWTGNLGYLPDGTPAVFDPAVYYGDREADVAMSELFGGFGRDFYAAYREAWPLDPGYVTRKTLYNLYHILNHLNLFGGGYLGQARAMIDRLLAEIR